MFFDKSEGLNFCSGSVFEIFLDRDKNASSRKSVVILIEEMGDRKK